MQTSKLRTIWIIILSCLDGIYICSLASWKLFTKKITRPWVNITSYNCAIRLLKYARVEWKVYNPYNTQPQPGHATIIMCNHSSLYDIPLSLVAFPNVSVRMLGKKELAKVPFIGKGMRAAEYPFIDRRNKQQAFKDLEKVNKLLKSGVVMWIAPEGTRGKDDKLSPFKKGGFITAIQTSANIIPVGIRGAFDILPPGTLQLHLGKTAEVHIGQSIDASQYTVEQKDDLIAKVFEEIKRLKEEIPPATLSE